MNIRLTTTITILLAITASACRKSPQPAAAQDALPSQSQSAASSDTVSTSTGLPKEALEYAAKRFPAALHIPKIVLSPKLKEYSFAAEPRFTEKHKALLSMSGSKNWAGVAQTILDHPPANASDVERAIEILGNSSWDYPVAIQSPKVSFDNQYFSTSGKEESKASKSISVIELPDFPNAFTLSSEGHIMPDFHMRNGSAGGLEQHPSKNGVLDRLHFGDYTAYYFEDSSSGEPGFTIENMIREFDRDIDAINRRKKLGELNSAQALTSANALAKVFTESILRIVLQQ